MRSRAPLIALGAVFLAMVVTPSEGRSEPSHWDTEFGPLVLDVGLGDVVSGAYAKFQGRFIGRLDRDLSVIAGNWIQPKSEIRCVTEIGGSHYWGRVVWKLAPDDTLIGKWAFCDQPYAKGGEWGGRMVSGVRPLEVATLDEGEPPPPENAPISASTTGTLAAKIWKKPVRENQLAITSADVTCDGATDQILTHLDLEGPDAPLFSVAVLPAGRPATDAAVTWFDFGGFGFTALCGAPRMVGVAVASPPAHEVAALTGENAPPLCRAGVRIDDGECDAVWVFTRPKKGGGIDLVVGRR